MLERKLSLKAWLLSVLLCLPMPALAQVSESNREIVPLARLIVLPADLSVSANRSDIIEGFATYCGALQRHYPTNSPAEQAWLWSEIEAGGQRMRRAFRSAESHRSFAEAFTENCLFATSLYRDDENQRAQAIFILIASIARFAPDAPVGAEINGLEPYDWGFDALQSAGVATLSQIGLIEANAQ